MQPVTVNHASPGVGFGPCPVIYCLELSRQIISILLVYLSPEIFVRVTSQHVDVNGHCTAESKEHSICHVPRRSCLAIYPGSLAVSL